LDEVSGLIGLLDSRLMLLLHLVFELGLVSFFHGTFYAQVMYSLICYLFM